MRAGGKDARGEPDPGHFERFCTVVVPDLLTDVCHVSTGLASQIGKDILARAESYAMLDDTAWAVLIAPFAEEVARYEPAGSSPGAEGRGRRGRSAAACWRRHTRTGRWKPAASRASPPWRRPASRTSWPPGAATQ